jgi:phosphate transport system protein
VASQKATHLEVSLQRDIDLIKSKVSAMFELDKRALNDGLRALTENNRQLAYGVILRDKRIDELEKEIDRLCLEFLVRQQPVALHLRFAYVTIKINAELERIGDYAESIARQVLKLTHADQKPSTAPFVEIAQLSIQMLQDAVTSFLDQDPALARATMAIEEKVDALRNQIKADLRRRQKAGEVAVEIMNPFLTIARRFERTSDQAQNICEEVIYMCTGEYAKHLGREVTRILLVDDHNACRGPMAEGIANAFGLPNLRYTSAGLDPKPLDQDMVRFMAGKKIDVSKLAPKSIDQVPNIDHYNVIIALSQAAKRSFPKPPTKTITLDWQAPDPSAMGGGTQEKLAALAETYEYLHNHLQDLSEAILGDKID